MSKRSGIGKSMFVRNWSNPLVQPKFDNPKIQNGLNVVMKWRKK